RHTRCLSDWSSDVCSSDLGLIIGCIGLAIISILFYRFSLKIPIKEFFIVTGILLYYMVFSFVGKGLHELQEGNLISITGIPKIRSEERRVGKECKNGCIRS